MKPLALVTAAELEVPDVDRPLVDRALAGRGVPTRWVNWDDPGVDWSDFAAAWIRSPWDYISRHRQFLDWAASVDAVSRLWNPAAVVSWNSHKSYLLDLAARDVPVVPTELVAAGQPVDLVALAQDRGWDEVVVKPAVSVGAIGTERVPPARARAWSARDAEDPSPVDRLVQPLVAEVSAGEVSLVAIEGRITHAVRKVPAPGDFRVQIEYGGHEVAHTPTDAELALAERALAAVGQSLLYARVDCVSTGQGPRLMELELIEPSLFLALAPPATLGTLADAVTARL